MLIGSAGALAHGTLLPLMILIFGNLLDAFTNRTFDLCTMNFTALAAEYCPPNYHLTAANYLASMT